MARLYKAGEGYSKSFTVSSSTGAAVNADSTPTGSMLRNGAADGTVTVTITNPATGQYKAAATIPGGYAAGDVVELLIAATIGAVATKAVVDAVRLVAFDPLNATSLGLANLDAAISTRSTYAGADTTGTTTLLARLTATRAGLLDNLDATISSRSTYAGADTAGTMTLVGLLTPTRAGNLDNLDAAVSTRSTYAGADTAGTGTLLGRLTAPRAAAIDNLDATVSSRSTYAGGAVASVTAGVMLDPAAFDPIAVEAGINARQALAQQLAALGGVLSGAATATVTVKGAGVASTRLVYTTDADGNRSAVVHTPPA
jgi:hypothetical protein